MSKIDIHWEILFERYSILKKIKEKGFFEISAKMINEEKEARLMTKFDHENSLPEIFKENSLAILPNTRGTYIIAPMKVYQKIDLEKKIKTEYFDFPDYIESIDINNITSEAIALNAAFLSDILRDFLNEDVLYPTINGRMGSKEFSFQINHKQEGSFIINVKNSQIEIDGGYESQDKFYILEAKNNMIETFLIRQLYYPYRLWKEKLNKEVIPVFFIYNNGVFRLFKYEFADEKNYNSLRLVESKNYICSSEKICPEDIEEILKTVTLNRNITLTFPQADSYNRLISICEFLKNNPDKKAEEIKEEQDFTLRQANYYLKAGVFLGLINGVKAKYSLSSLGEKIFSLPYKPRQLELAKLVLKEKVFFETLKNYFIKFEFLSKMEIAKILEEDYSLAKVTAERRASTVVGWCRWILNLIEY